MSMFSLPDMYGMHFGQKLQPIEESAMQAVEIRMLEEAFDEDVKCEAKHKLTVCTGEVTHVVWTACEPTRRLICNAAAAHNLRLIAYGLACSICLESPESHWHVEPFG